MTEQPRGRLDGRTAIVTGASRGIGQAIAEAYAREGATLFLTATRLENLDAMIGVVEELGGTAHPHASDVSDPNQIEAMFNAAVHALGRVDVLVNNAGIYKGKPFTDYSLDEFDQVMRVNVYGVFQMMQLALRHMADQGGGKIVNIASTAGRWESPNQAAYNASKHAVVGLTRCAALENAAKGINVNAICPGFVETDMIDEFKSHADRADIDFESFKAATLDRVPIGRMLQPVEIAHLAVYLASGEADGMTGQAIAISGGMRMG